MILIRLAGPSDGIDAARQIRERWRIPVIYLTAYADDNTLRRASVTEPWGYLLKPFEDSQLRTAIEMAASLKQKVEERELPLAELLAAQEAFITSSGGGVLPITRVNGKVIRDGRPGELTRQLADTYWAWHRLPQYRTPISY